MDLVDTDFFVARACCKCCNWAVSMLWTIMFCDLEYNTEFTFYNISSYFYLNRTVHCNREIKLGYFSSEEETLPLICSFKIGQHKCASWCLGDVISLSSDTLMHPFADGCVFVSYLVKINIPQGLFLRDSRGDIKANVKSTQQRKKLI